MPRTSPHIVQKQDPVGTQLVRLDSIPLEQRLAAIHHLMRYQGLTEDEAVVMLDLCIDPQDTSTRIAA